MSESNTNEPTSEKTEREAPSHDTPVFYRESAEGRYLVFLDYESEQRQ